MYLTYLPADAPPPPPVLPFPASIQDSQLVVERYKSGFEPPEPIPFDDLSDWRPPEPQLGQLPPPPASSPKPPNTVKGTLSARKFGKRGGIFGIFGGSKVCLVWEKCGGGGQARRLGRRGGGVVKVAWW